MGDMGFHSAAGIHNMVEAMRHTYVDRNFNLGDPDFVKNPIEKLLSEDHAAAIRAKIDPAKATPSKDVQPGTAPHEGDQTTHYSIVDEKGDAVSVTYTINALFGAKVMAGDTGFFLNDEMDDFTTKPGVPNLFGLVQGTTNVIAPGKRPVELDEPHHRHQGWQDLHGAGQPRRLAHHHHRSRNADECRGLRHEHAGSRGCAAHPSSMAAG